MKKQSVLKEQRAVTVGEFLLIVAMSMTFGFMLAMIVFGIGQR